MVRGSGNFIWRGSVNVGNCSFSACSSVVYSDMDLKQESLCGPQVAASVL